jgi:hypothetical protein
MMGKGGWIPWVEKRTTKWMGGGFVACFCDRKISGALLLFVIFLDLLLSFISSSDAPSPDLTL